jgi:hypothetical protein
MDVGGKGTKGLIIPKKAMEVDDEKFTAAERIGRGGG